jgi:hypothetical protein
MKHTRSNFKLLLRKCRADSDRLSSDKLAQNLLANESKAFWDEVKKVSKSNTYAHATTINGISGKKNICHMWKDHFQGLLNSSRDVSKRASVTESIFFPKNVECEYVTPLDVKEAICKLKSGKASGRDGLSSEHYLYASNRVYVHLSIIFNSMMLHGFIPDHLMDTIIISLLKDKKGNVMDKDNYRPIAITCVSSKILELIILAKYKDCLVTGDHQFGFKQSSSTDQCVFVLKEIIDHYSCQSSPTYACFMDASKAFDRVNHWGLLDKLIQRNVPKILVRLLMVWFTTQSFVIGWNGVFSESFTVSNGVRQGGILSPLFFNVFIEELSCKLSSLNVGCYMNGICFNHFNYADDCILIAPSPSALQELIDICTIFAKDNDMLYNTKKTVCMAFIPKMYGKLHIPQICLNNRPLKWVDENKYLGMIISNDCKDNMDIKRQIRALYARGNILVRNFVKCSPDVKVQLFKTYCSNIYAGHLWSNYSQAVFRRMNVAYNNVFRHLMHIKRDCSISQYFVNLHVHGFKPLLRNYIHSFSKRLQDSSNSLVQTVLNSSHFIYGSKLNNTWHKFVT